MQPMGPLVADIVLQQNAVIGPLVADIVLQQNAANGSASCGEASTIVKFLRLKKFEFYNLNIS